MALLMFEDKTQAPMRELLENTSLTQLASDVNKAILLAHGHQADLKIAFYWQMLQWSQEQLRRQVMPNGKRLDFPTMNDPLLSDMEYENDDDQMQGDAQADDNANRTQA